MYTYLNAAEVSALITLRNFNEKLNKSSQITINFMLVEKLSPAGKYANHLKILSALIIYGWVNQWGGAKLT